MPCLFYYWRNLTGHNLFQRIQNWRILLILLYQNVSLHEIRLTLRDIQTATPYTNQLYDVYALPMRYSIDIHIYKCRSFDRNFVFYTLFHLILVLHIIDTLTNIRIFPLIYYLTIFVCLPARKHNGFQLLVKYIYLRKQKIVLMHTIMLHRWSNGYSYFLIILIT